MNNDDNLSEQVVLRSFRQHNYATTSALMADFDAKKLYIKKTFLEKPILIDFNQITSFTPVNRGHHISKHHRVTRGLVGGFLAGGIGAGIGASTGGKDYDQIDELSIIINFKNGTKRKIKFGSLLKANSFSANASFKKYDENVSLMNSVIASKNVPQSNSDSGFDNKLTDSKVERLTHLKRLLDLDVITQSEFNEEKKRILGI